MPLNRKMRDMKKENIRLYLQSTINENYKVRNGFDWSHYCR